MASQRFPRYYRVKGIAGIETYLEVLHENPEGYDILITSMTDHSIKESQEFISRHLLEACIRTGYLTECPEPVHTMSA